MPTTTVSVSVYVDRKVFTKSPKAKDSLRVIAKWRLQSAKCKLQNHVANSNNRSDKSLLFCIFQFAFCTLH